jgi:hypothetical protein
MSAKTWVGDIGTGNRLHVFPNIFPSAHHFGTVCT